MPENFDRLSQSELVGNKVEAANSNLVSDAWNWVDNHKVETAAVVVGTAALAFGASKFLGNFLKGGSEDVGSQLGSGLTSSAFERALAQSSPTASKLATRFAADAAELASGRLALTGSESMETLAARGLASKFSGSGEAGLASKFSGEAGLATELKLASGGEGAAEKAMTGLADTTMKRLGMSTGAVPGDIGKVQADALITPINSEGMWWGALDGVIQRNAGMQFHAQAAAAMPLADGQVVLAAKTAAHRGAFDNVVFVVDDLRKPLRDVVFNGLQAAEKAGYQSVSLPALRTGVMAGKVEKTVQQTVDEMAAGVKSFMATGPKSLKDIKFVVYNNDEILSKLTAALAK